MGFSVSSFRSRKEGMPHHRPHHKELLMDVEERAKMVRECEQALEEAKNEMNRIVRRASCIGIDFNAIAHRVRRGRYEMKKRVKAVNEELRTQQKRFREENGLPLCRPKSSNVRVVVQDGYELLDPAELKEVGEE